MKSEKIAILSFYKFVELPNFRELQKPFYNYLNKNCIKGTIILAQEGINASISGYEQEIYKVLDYIKKDSRFSDVEHKLNFCDIDPFNRLKIKLKKEVIPAGVKSVNPNELVGDYVNPSEWNNLLKDTEVLLIDTRNDYEVSVGTFKGAENPKIRYFREFQGYAQKRLDPKKHKKIAMFCTGGIRCEKASSYLLNKGFKNIYHLRGGILKYLEEIPKEESLWEGECFVFDDRASITHNLDKGTYELCRNCRMPLSIKDRRSEKYEEGISCTYCYDSLTHKRISSLMERKKQMELAKLRNQKHLGAYIHKRKLDY